MRFLIKSSAMLGAILGAILGLILLIPYVKCLSCFSFALSGAGVLYYLKKNSFADKLSIHDGAIIGAVSGFTAFVAASVVYLPMSYALGLLFSPITKSGPNFATSFILASYNLFIIPLLIFSIALLTALFSALSGLIAAYIYEQLEKR